MELDFAEVLLEVIDRRASDLHITAGAPPMVRVRGRLTPIDGYAPLTPTDTREIVYSILSNAQRQKLEQNWQLDLAYQLPATARFRVNAYFQRSAVAAAFRLLPFDVVPLETLGLPPVVAEFANRPRGLVLVTGPTGSGKSTTLASLIDVINASREEHIMTIEDPIEFLHQHKKCIVNQRELGSDATSFGDALKAALRQDPDLIREGKSHQIYSVLQTGGAHGMQTMDASLAQLVRAGKISRQLAESRAHSLEEFRRLIGAPVSPAMAA